MTAPDSRLDPSAQRSSAEPAPDAPPRMLITPAEDEELRRRWDDLQVRFVEDPRGQVAEADQLVGDLLDQLRAGLDRHRSELRRGWEHDEEVTTEQLRQTLQAYRTFFEQTLRTPGP
jgi:hypothetical protein